MTEEEEDWLTSKNEFSDSECPNLKNADMGSLASCKVFCHETPDCTAFNYNSGSTRCVLRACKVPVVPPARDSYSSYDGYWLSSTFTGS